MVEKQSDLMLKNHEDRNISYKDLEGGDQTKKITLHDSGVMDGMAIADYLSKGEKEKDWVKAGELICSNVITNPSYSFDDENKIMKDYHADYLSKDIKYTNQNDEDVTIKFTFPGYRTALDIVMNYAKGDDQDELNMRATTQKLLDHIFKQEDGTKADENFFNYGGAGRGLIIPAFRDAMTYLQDILNHDGFLSAIIEASTFLGTSLRSK